MTAIQNIFQSIAAPKEGFFAQVLEHMKQKKGMRKLLLKGHKARWFHQNCVPDEWFCNKRQQEIFAVLRKEQEPMTDRQLAVALGFADMNAVRPRITEAISKGYLVETGDIIDADTGKYVRLVNLTPAAI